MRLSAGTSDWGPSRSSAAAFAAVLMLGCAAAENRMMGSLDFKRCWGQTPSAHTTSAHTSYSAADVTAAAPVATSSAAAAAAAQDSHAASKMRVLLRIDSINLITRFDAGAAVAAAATTTVKLYSHAA